MSTNRSFRLIIVLALVVVLMFTIQEAVATSFVIRSDAKAAVIDEMQRSQTAQAADAGRWNKQAQYFLEKQVPVTGSAQRSQAAETARLNAQADYFRAKQLGEAERIQRVRSAETARWNAMTEFFMEKTAKNVPASR